MQLPRGTFCGIRKKRVTGEILRELEQGRFTGICCISRHDGVCTLVFRTGTCILAEYNAAKGDAALEGLLLSVAGDIADAALSTLDEAQVRLCLEFNRAEKVVKVHQPLRARTKPLPPPAHPPPYIPVDIPLPAADTLGPQGSTTGTAVRSTEKISPYAVSHHPPPEPILSARAEKAAIQKESLPSENERGRTLFEDELDTLDTLDLDRVRNKIRNECKSMVRHLGLDHLMDKD